MGDHYTPRKYLEGFCDPTAPGRIWVYDRLKKNRFRTNLVNVAQENGFYSPEDERELNRMVEAPANAVLDKLRSGESMTGDDRDKLAFYIATFMYRVPYQRAMCAEAAPGLLKETVEEVKALIKQAGEIRGLPTERIQKKLDEADQYLAKHADDPTAPIMDKIRSPWPGEAVYQLVLGMTWRILWCSGPSFFLTSDNPAFFFRWLGVGRPESELSFPLATNLLLHGSWQPGRQDQRVEVPEKLVKELNRRTASKSTRFLFYHKWEDWVAQLGDKGQDGHRLNAIMW